MRDLARLLGDAGLVAAGVATVLVAFAIVCAVLIGLSFVDGFLHGLFRQ